MLVDQWENSEVEMMVVKTELMKADETVELLAVEWVATSAVEWAV